MYSQTNISYSGMKKPHNLQDTLNQGCYCLTNRLPIPPHLLLFNKQHRLQPPHLRRSKMPSSIPPNSTTPGSFCQPTNNLTHSDHTNQLNILHQILPLQTSKCSLNYASISSPHYISGNGFWRKMMTRKKTIHLY